jgi:hypothetical protein
MGAVEVVDRVTYDALERLIARGLVARAPGPARELHRGPGLKREGPSPEEARRRRSTAEIDLAVRKGRMAQVLEEGGFPAEALVSVHEGVEAAVRALAVLADGEPPGTDGVVLQPEPGPTETGSGEWSAPGSGPPEPETRALVQAWQLHALLVPRGLLTEEEAAWVSALRDLVDSKGEPASSVGRLLKRGRSLIERASETATRSALHA